MERKVWCQDCGMSLEYGEGLCARGGVEVVLSKDMQSQNFIRNWPAADNRILAKADRRIQQETRVTVYFCCTQLGLHR